MQVFAKLRALRDFERLYLPFLQTLQDLDVIVEIGFHEVRGKPISLTQLYLTGIGGVATIQRRLTRLKRLGVVEHRKSAEDGRHRELILSGKLSKVFARYDARLDWNVP